MAIVLVGAPSCDVYGSDLQMLETVAALRSRGHGVVVATPADGPLHARLAELGAQVRIVPSPVLRRADANPAGMARLATATARSLPVMRRLVRETRAVVVYANTLTVPWWLAAARAGGARSLCHVHEAESQDPRIVRRILAAPLSWADVVVVNSRTTHDTLREVAPQLDGRIRLIHNGVEPPPTPPRLPGRAHPLRLVVVGRLSARKAPDVALEATAALRAAGRDVVLELCGTPSPGQEAYAAGLRSRAARPDLAGAVTFTGYASPIWPALARAHVVVATSLGESFGNAVVEGQLALRPVVASAVQGHWETVEDGVTGLLVPPQDPGALAAAIGRLDEDPRLVERLARTARATALARFTAARYRQDIGDLVEGLVAGGLAAAG